jgi:hypothetical protein
LQVEAGEPTAWQEEQPIADPVPVNGNLLENLDLVADRGKNVFPIMKDETICDQKRLLGPHGPETAHHAQAGDFKWHSNTILHQQRQ